MLENLPFMQDLHSPCAVFIGTETDYGSFRKELTETNIDKVIETTNLLRENGIDAVPCFSEEAEAPSKTVVTATGIQTPVFKPKVAQEAAAKIKQILKDQKKKEMRVKPGRDLLFKLPVYPVTFEQMAPISNTSKRFYGDFCDPDLSNPNNNEVNATRKKYGFDLEYKLCNEALNSSSLLSSDQLAEKNSKSLQYVYRGGVLGNKPYTSLASSENKNIAYSSPDIKTAMQYSGCFGDYGAKLKAFSPSSQESIRFGFVYEYKTAKDTSLFKDWAIERGENPSINQTSKSISRQDWENKAFETPVFPDKNKVNNIYLHLRKDGNDVFYPINQNDKRWQAMLSLYAPADTSKRGYMIGRRNNILRDKKVYSSYTAKTLGIFKKKLKPYQTDESKQELLRKSNTTIEELNTKTSNNNQTNMSYQERVQKIKELRGLSSPSTAIQRPTQQQSLSQQDIIAYKKGSNTL